MKQLIIILLLLVATFSSAYPGNQVTMVSEMIYIDHCDGQGYSTIDKLAINITIDFDKNLIKVGDLKSFNIHYYDTYQYRKYNVLKCICYDMNGTECLVEYFIYPKHIYIKISYNNFIYKYKCVNTNVY